MAVNRTSKAIGKIVDMPNAPTIGTASDNGAVGATVPFTAATNGGPVIYYTAISNPGSISATSATSPITVSGLSANTTYTFTVAAVNPTGTSAYSSASNSVTPAPLDYGALFPIRSYVVPSAGASTISFTSIPSTYSHLQLRCVLRASRNDTADGVVIQYNGDTASNYSWHYFRGDGSSTAGSGAASSATYMAIQDSMVGQTGGSNIFGSLIIEIFDYANTSKFKTQRSIGGNDRNGAGYVDSSSGNWRSTNAITSIDIKPLYGTGFARYSSVALFGVKA